LTLIALSFLIDSRSLASPNDEMDWWTGTAIWKAWHRINLLNKTLSQKSTSSGLQDWFKKFDEGKAIPKCGVSENYSLQNQTDSFKWLRDIWTAILATPNLAPSAPPTILTPSPILIPSPKIDLGSLWKIPSSNSPDLGIFRKIWDEILGTKRPVEPYDDGPSNPQEALEKAKQEEGKIINPSPGGPLHKQGKREAAEWLRQHGEKNVVFEKGFHTPYGDSNADVESENYMVEVKTGHESMSPSVYEESIDELNKLLYHRAETGKTLTYYIVDDLGSGPYPNLDNWLDFIYTLERYGVIIIYGTELPRP